MLGAILVRVKISNYLLQDRIFCQCWDMVVSTLAIRECLYGQSRSSLADGVEMRLPSYLLRRSAAFFHLQPYVGSPGMRLYPR